MEPPFEPSALAKIKCLRCGKPMAMRRFNYTSVANGFESIDYKCLFCGAEETRPYPPSQSELPSSREGQKVLTQIYEISSPEEARAISEIGIDHIGVLVGDGEFPREQSLSRAAEIGAAVASAAKLSALFLTARSELIVAWARELRPDILHLGAAPELLSPAQVSDIKDALPEYLIMRSVPVIGEESLSIAQSYRGIVDYLLLDSHRPADKQIGAVGIPHDWNISRRIVELGSTPVILAGGLGPENVANAIWAVRPAGVDSKTKTDRDASHTKDLDRVRRFHHAARAAMANENAG